MKRNSIFFVNSTHKTKTWWTFVSVLVLVFIPFLILWILACEFNVLDTNWIIAKGQMVWHGVIEQGSIQTIANKYGMFYDGGVEKLASDLANMVGQSKAIMSNGTYFNAIVLVPLFGLLIVAIAYPIIFNATKLSGLDVLPFASAIGFAMFVMILCGLIPHWGSNLEAMYWIVRLIIGLTVGAIAFIATNAAVNKFLAGREYATDIYFGYKVNDAATKEQRQQLKENVDAFKHNKDNDKDYVEVEQEVK